MSITHPVTREQDITLRLCQIARAINASIDAGEHLHVLETRRRIFDGELFTWLGHMCPTIRVELWGIPALHQAEILEIFEDLAAARAEHKYGVTNNGFCLLLAYIIEAIQSLAAS